MGERQNFAVFDRGEFMDRGAPEVQNPEIKNCKILPRDQINSFLSQSKKNNALFERKNCKIK